MRRTIDSTQRTGRETRVAAAVLALLLGAAGSAARAADPEVLRTTLPPGIAAVPPLPPTTVFSVQLVLDDDTPEATFGVISGQAARQFLWFQRFTPGQPFDLEELWVLFPAVPGAVAGAPVQLAVYADADGNPANGATLLSSFNTTIQVADNNTFSIYPLASPVFFDGTGDLLVGVVPRFITSGVTPITSPASLDNTASQQRSWFATWTGDPPDPPVLTPPPSGNISLVDDFGSPGNWMIRAFGNGPNVVAIPALGQLGLVLLTTLLAAAALVMSRRRARQTLLLGLAMMALAGVAGAVDVDTFATAQVAVSDPGTSSGVVSGPGILGTERDLRVLRTSGAGTVTAAVGGSGLSFTAPTATAGELRAAWDGADGNATTLNPIGISPAANLTTGNAAAFRFAVSSAAAATQIVIEVWTDATHASRAARRLPAIASATDVVIGFAELRTIPGLAGPATLTSVGAVQLRVFGSNTPAGATITISRVDTIAPTLGALKADFVAGAPTAGPITPGGQQTYRVTITNTGGTAASVNLADTLDPSLTLSGVVRTSPIAAPDGYSTPNGTVLDTVAAGQPSLLANDTDPDGDAVTAVASPGQATAQGGTVTIATDGHFVYSPPAGFTGVDAFTYLLQAAGGDPSEDANDTALSLAGTAHVIVEPVPPVLTAGGTLDYTENDPPTNIDTTITVNDADSANLQSATAQITGNYVNGEDILSFVNAPPITGVFTPVDGTMTLSGSASLAAYQAALRAVRYNNTSENPSIAPRTVTWIGNDGGLTSLPVTSTINVTRANDAPVLDNTGNMSLTAIDEDVLDASNTGTLVSAIIASAGGDRITDVDSGAVEGIAVTATVITNGAWEYTTTGGAPWNPIGSPNDDAARLLASDASTRVRFVPNANFSGTVDPGITFRAWDQTSGANGGVGDTTPNGGTTAFSTATETASIVVNPINDAPVLDNTGNMSLTAIDEDVASAANTGTLVSAIIASAGGDRITDVDTGALEGIAVTAVVNTNGAWQFSTAGGAGPWTPFGTPSDGVARLLASDGLTRVRFVPNLNFFGTVDPGIGFRAWDQSVGTNGTTANTIPNGGTTPFSTATETASIVVNPVNDPPSFATNPIAYTALGNTQLRAGELATGNSVAHIRDNSDVGEKSVPTDIDGPAPPFTYSLGTAPTNGQVSVNSDGTFTYEPNPGFPGPDTFTVNVSDGGSPAASAPVTVNVTISEMVWYVHDVVGANNPAAGDDGRSTNAFEDLEDGALIAAVTDNDWVFVFEGNSPATPHGGFRIDNTGVKLHGEGIGLTVAPFGNVVPAGDEPRIDNSADVPAQEDNGVSVVATAASLTGVEIRGLQVEGRDNGIDITATGANNAGVRISDNIILSDAATGLEGVDFNAGSTGTSTLAFDHNTLTARGTALDFTRTAGTAFVSAFNDNVVTGTSAAAGLIVTGTGGVVTFDATPGGGIQPVPGGTTVIGTPGDRIGGAGLTLSNVTGALNYANLAAPPIGAGDLDIFTDSGAALTVAGGAGGFDFDVTVNAGILQANAGPAAIISSADIDLQLNSLTSGNSASNGVSLTTVTGTFSAPSGSAITNAGTTDFAISGGSVAVTYAGTITDDVGQLVSIASSTGTSLKAFTGAITDGDDGDGSGVSLTGNSATTTMRFSGGLLLSTGANSAFTATGGGVVEVCDENPCNPAATGLAVNRITTTTGTALNVANTTIGANNLELRSISAGTAASGPTNGIVLNATGTSGGLKVRGTGSSGSGGTIQRTGGVGVLLTSTQHVSLSSMNIQNAGDDGIRGQGVHNFELIGSNLTTNGNATAENGLQFGEATGTVAGITGTLTITNTNVSGSAGNNVHIRNTSGTLDAMNISGGSFDDLNDTTGANSFLFEMSGTAVATAASLTNVGFDNNSPQRALEVQTHDTGRIGSTSPPVSYFIVSGGTFANNGIHASFTQDSSSNLAFKFLNNGTAGSPIAGTVLQVVNVFSSSQATGGTIVGEISGNHINTGAVNASGIEVVIQGQTDATLLLNGNVINNTSGSRGISVAFRGPANPLAGTLGANSVINDVTVTNNNVDNGPVSNFPLAAISVEADNQSGADNKSPTVRADIRANTVPAAAAFDLLSTRLQFYEYDGVNSHGIGQLVDTPPASADATAQLTSTNTGTASAFGVALIPGPINTPP